MKTQLISALVVGATLAFSAGGAQAGWDGYIKSNISQFGEPVRLDMINEGKGYKLKTRTYRVPVEYRAEVSGNKRTIRQIDVQVRNILHGKGSTYGLRRKLEQQAAWGKINLDMWPLHLAPMEKLGRDLCKSHGGTNIKEIKTQIPVQMQVLFQNKDASLQTFTKDGNVPALVMCHPQQPKRESVALKLTDLKVYTVPAKPACGKPVRLVAEFWTNKAGKIDFQLARGDGEMQKASVQTQSVGGKYVKRWGKEYKFSKSESRKYMILVTGHPASSKWVPINVRCVGKDARPGAIKG